MVAAPLVPQALAHLSSFDQHSFAQLGFGQRVECPFLTVHSAFEHHASTRPDAVAAEHLGESITYAELNLSANALAGRLRSMGVVRGSRVCLLVQRSIPMLVAILAILKAGAAYVPLDGSIVTQSTLEYVIINSSSRLVLALGEFCHRVESGQVISLDDCVIRGNVATEPFHQPSNSSTPEDTVYIIYTSGTTGRPKGVEVKHGNVVNLVCLSPGNIGMQPGRRVSQLMNVGFDMAAWEILGSLCNGCTLCIRGKTSKDWRAVMKTVDVVVATPSMMVPHAPADYPNIRVIATAGEACPQSLADSWAENAVFYNCCGPTEITIVNTVQFHVAGRKLTIGRPTPNNNVYVLDGDMIPLPIGEAGVMWAGGAGISKGYVNLPEKTIERYRLDPFTNDGTFMFNTGDLGRWCADGTLEHLGRVDDQVKVKGFRVELDGVAAAMETCLEVTMAAALLIDTELWGFVSPATVEIASVKAAASKIQPYYAVPTRFLTLDQFPRTGNGKTNKRELRRLAIEKIGDEQTQIPANKGKIQPSPPVVVEVPTLTALNAPVPSPSAAYAASVTQHSLSTADLNSATPSSTVCASSSSSLSRLEKGNIWDGYEDDTVPEKTQGRTVRNLRHQVFSLYRRLFGVVLVVNVALIIDLFVRGDTSTKHLGLIVVSNLFCAILMRQDYVINAFFAVFCSVPVSWPLSIRRVCARVYHIGGLHSGCAVSGVMWLVAFTVQATRELINGGPASLATVVLTYWILLFLLLIVALAYPQFRMLFHNRFEASHRFLGWSATAFVWGQVVLLVNDYRSLDQTLGSALVKAPPFWLVAIMTLSIALPWIRLRKVPVRSVVLSNHAVRLYFDYVTPVAGSFTRISDSPLMEWHGFATIPEPGKSGYSLVVSKAGDWTAKQIANPPKELWVRGIPTCGVLRITTLFRRVVFVATGSGIAPNVRQTFGDKLVDSILERSPNAVVYDTRVHGKPDMIKLTLRLVREFDAEAVCIISNPKLTRKVVYGMTSRGIPAFGAIWDS